MYIHKTNVHQQAPVYLYVLLIRDCAQLQYTFMYKKDKRNGKKIMIDVKKIVKN